MKLLIVAALMFPILTVYFSCMFHDDADTNKAVMAGVMSTIIFYMTLFGILYLIFGE